MRHERKKISKVYVEFSDGSKSDGVTVKALKVLLDESMSPVMERLAGIEMSLSELGTISVKNKDTSQEFTRTQIRRLVGKLAELNPLLTHGKIYDAVYARISSIKGFDVRRTSERKGYDSTLKFIDEQGWLVDMAVILQDMIFEARETKAMNGLASRVCVRGVTI